MANQHIYPSTITRLANEINQLVAHARAIDAQLSQINAIAGQIGVINDPNNQEEVDAANAALASEFGYANGVDARAAINILGSWEVELDADPFFQQVLSRMG